LYTKAALEHLAMPALFDELISQVESYEDVGEVMVYLLDMHPIWENRRHRFHTVVKPEDSVYTIERDFPLAPPLLWEYLTKPEYRTIIFGADSQRLEDLKQGRISDGSVYVCAHGKNITLQSIVDWHPFEQYTVKSSTPGGGDSLVTTLLTPQENGTTVTVLSGKTQAGAAIMRGPVNIVIRRIIGPTLKKHLQAFGELIENEIAEGRVTQLPPVQINADQIEFALAESLAEA
jgi:uncharacterized protein YndB with AHSA1/START domain